jgi:hypothetical protein
MCDQIDDYLENETSMKLASIFVTMLVLLSFFTYESMGHKPTLVAFSPKTYLINFAHNCCKLSSAQNCQTGMDVGGFDVCRTFTMDDLDREFRANNSMILRQSRGAGYWLWKPYIIYYYLRTLRDNDVLMYTDSGSHFVASADTLFNMVRDDPRGVLLFGMNHKHKTWTKRDSYVLMDCDNTLCWNSYQHMASFSVWRRTDYSLDFAQRWLNFSTDARILTDQPNVMGKPNLPDFQDHRHDQSVMSLLAVKDTVATYRDPSTDWHMGYHAYSPYPKIIQHTRWHG